MTCTWSEGCDKAVIAQGLCAEHHEDYRRKVALFNDITRADLPCERDGGYFRFSDRIALHEYLWAQGWRREVRPEDVTETAATAAADAGGHVQADGEGTA